MKHLSFLLLLTALSGLFFAGCKKPAPSGLPPLKVRTGTAVGANVPLLVRSFGTLQANIAVTIVPQVSATLMQQCFKDGTVVEEGQLLYVLDQRSFLADVEKARAQVRSSKAVLEVAKDLMTRSEPLLKDHLISTQDFETLVSNADQALQALYMAEADLALAEINLGYTEIRSPIKGLTGITQINPGNYVETGHSQILSINQIDPIFVDFWVPSYQFGSIQTAYKKDPLSVTITATDVAHFTPVVGTVTLLDNYVNTQTASFQIRATLPNPDYTLWDGQFVNVDLTIGTIENAVLVDQSAISIGVNGPYAFVVNADMTASLRQVKTAENYNGKVVLTDGIKAGETVVTLGQMNLRDGMKVLIDNTVPPTAP